GRNGHGGHGRHRRPVRPLPPRRPRVRGGAHLPRGGRRVREPGDPLLRRQGLHPHAAPGAQGVHARAGAVRAAARGHRAQLPRGPGLPRPHGRPARAAAARRLRAGLHRPRCAQGTPRRHPQPAADAAAHREDRRRAVRRRVRRRAPRRGEGPGQGAGVLAARRVLPVGPAPPAPRAVEPVQRPARARRARAGVPAVQLDRAGRVAVHRPGGHRTAGDLLRPRARGVPAGRDVADGRRMGRPEGRRAGGEADGALPDGGRHVLHRGRRLRRRHHREGDHGDRRLPAHRARRHPRRRQALRGRDGRPQARGVLLDMSTITSEALAETTLLRFATAGSVDDGKSTLVGRLLHDSKSVLTDQLEAVERASASRGQEAPDLALLTDGLRAEREQGITIDVAYRYFATPRRRFILADTPGHVQYTRNMVTGASTAELTVILVDARNGVVEQTRRHAAIAALLRVPHVVLAVNKMDLVGYRESVFAAIAEEFTAYATELGVPEVTAVPISALVGDNVVEPSAHMDWYGGPTVLEHLETVPVSHDLTRCHARLPVQ